MMERTFKFKPFVGGPHAWMICHHEAAHAVAAYLLGQRFDYVSVVEYRQRTGEIAGGTLYFPKMSPQYYDDASAFNDAVVATTACATQGIVYDRDISGCGSDFDRIFHLCERYLVDVDEVYRAAFRIHANHWPAINAVAHAINALGKVSRRGVSSIVDAFEGCDSHEEYRGMLAELDVSLVDEVNRRQLKVVGVGSVRGRKRIPCE